MIPWIYLLEYFCTKGTGMLFKIMCSEKSLEIQCLKDLFQLDIKMNKDFLFMPFSLGFWKRYHVKAYMDSMDNELMSSMICHYLARHWFSICHSFSGTIVFLLNLPGSIQLLFLALIMLEKVLLCFFYHPVYILLQLPGNKPWTTYCCSPPFTTGNISQVYLP